MKLHFAKKALLSLLLCGIILSPIAYLILRGEYDREQMYVPQVFREDAYSYAEPQQSLVEQKIIATEDNWAGFDLVIAGEGDLSRLDVLVSDERQQIIRTAEVHQSILISRDVLNYRFDPIHHSKGNVYSIVFSCEGECDIKIPYSLIETNSWGELYIDEELQPGLLNLVPVYATNNGFEILRVLSRRVLTVVFSE